MSPQYLLETLANIKIFWKGFSVSIYIPRAVEAIVKNPRLFKTARKLKLKC